MKSILRFLKKHISYHRKNMKLISRLLLLCLLGIGSILAINVYVLSFSSDTIYTDIEKLEPKKVWLVLWASVFQDWTPSDILRDRLDGTYEAYKIWKIEKIIVSGDNSVEKYDEPTAMQKYLMSQWVSEQDIYLDYAWFDTFDSIYRASYIFSVDDMIIFTQKFHLERALYISQWLWVEATWYATDFHAYVAQDYNNRREILSRVKAFLEIEILDAKPKFLWEKISID